MSRIRKPDVPLFSRPALCASQEPALKDDFTADYSDPDLRGAKVATLKKLCKACAALQECRDFALRSPGEVGVWGGMTARERRDIRRRGASS